MIIGNHVVNGALKQISNNSSCCLSYPEIVLMNRKEAIELITRKSWK